MENISIKIYKYKELRELLRDKPEKEQPDFEPNIHYWRGLPPIQHADWDKNFFVMAFDISGAKEKVVGVMELQLANYPNVIWLMSIGVALDYRRRGVSKQMCAAMCNFVKEKDLQLESSTPTEMGELYLKPALVRAVKASGVKVFYTQAHWYT